MIKTSKETKAVVLSAVNKLVDFLKPAYGPANNKILIETSRGLDAVDDGKTIAENYESDDEAENAVIKFLYEVARKTNQRVGDGTTTSLLFTQAILNNIEDNFDQRKVVQELKDGFEKVKEHLLKSSTPISSLAELKRVALTSFNNKKAAEVIAEAIFEAGPDGIVTSENSTSMEMSYEVVNGVKISNGLVSPYLINTSKGTAEVMNPYVFITDKILSSVKDITALMETLQKSNKKELLLISAGLERDALATIVLNTLKGNYHIAAVNMNSHAEGLQDLADIVGAKIISERLGRTLGSVELQDLGMCEKVVSSSEETTIIGTKGDRGAIEQKISQVKEQLANSTKDEEIRLLKGRLARLLSKVVVIKIGAPTEKEIEALGYKIEDSINATQAAFRGGVNLGAGQAYLDIKVKSKGLQEALKAPHGQIIENIGEGDYSKVQDPTEVLIAALESAVSIACLLIELKGIKVATKKQENGKVQLD